MLKNIHIRDFALAENLEIEFGSGLNILTGETGTGKSIVVGAISAVLGGRVFTEVVRTGSEKSMIEAIFDISKLDNVKKILREKGLENSEELFLRREISVKGSTRAFVNDVPVTISSLAEIGDELVDIHSQNEHQSLLRKEIHRFFLDTFGQLHGLLNEVGHSYENLLEIRRQIQALERKQKDLEEKHELYEFQLDEINKANLQIDEEGKLESERNILVNSEKIFNLSAEFNQLVSGGDANLQKLMGQAVHVLRELSEFSDELNSIYKEFASAKIITEEADRTIEEFRNRMQFDPNRLEEIEQRLATIKALQKKYGSTIEKVLDYRDRIKSELQIKENFDFEAGKLNKIYIEAIKNYGEQALKLSKARDRAARKLESEVMALLQKLGMPRIKFKVQMDWEAEPNGLFHHEGKEYAADEYGIDQIEFYISPNPGEDFKPLAKIASGGEISRIMLALKNILAEIDRIPLLIFDEIDAGVSGRIALAVGKSIQQLSQSHQIICITHLPQIASFGQAHLRVEKYVKNDRTFTEIKCLAEGERVEEIARLMGGEKISDTIKQSARQLLEEAGVNS